MTEVLRAGIVLALLLFAFGAAMPQVQVGDSPAVAASIAQAAASDLCGGGWGDKFAGHAPCHACRSGVPLLPAGLDAGISVCRDRLAVAYAAVPPIDPRALRPPRPLSRGPPALA